MKVRNYQDLIDDELGYEKIKTKKPKAKKQNNKEWVDEFEPKPKTKGKKWKGR